MINFGDYTDFFIFLGGLLILCGIIYFLFRNKFNDIFISEEEMPEPEVSRRAPVVEVMFPTVSKDTVSSPMLKKIGSILLAIIIGGFLLNQFLMWKLNSAGSSGKPFDISISVSKK